MSRKEDILESWIMVEHLSEGDINIKDRNVFCLENVNDDNYYDFLMQKMNLREKIHGKCEELGIIIYFDIFNFNEIIEFLREKYNLEKTEEEIYYGDKFSFALYFNKHLQLLNDMTFVSEHYYIKNEKEIPRLNEFNEYQRKFKTFFNDIFPCYIREEKKKDNDDEEKDDDKKDVVFVDEAEIKFHFNKRFFTDIVC